jgi:type II secretory pathway pseudopilin PulG
MNILSGRVALALPVNLRQVQQARLSGKTGGARPGLTLVEVILVLSLLVIIGAVTVPLLEGTLTRSRLGHGGDLLRAAWSRARLAATQSGQAYAFRFEPRGSRYEIIPLAQLTDPSTRPLEATSVEDTMAEGDEDDDARASGDSLPSGVTFADLQVSTSSQLQSEQSVGAAWSRPILFYPDGTTSDAVVTLANEEGLTLHVTLRGLTGTARVGEIGSGGAP